MLNKKECITFISDLANGVDPKTGEVLEKDSIINRSDIIRGLFAIKEYLENDTIKSKKTEKIPFELTNTDVLLDGDVAITNFVRNINELNCIDGMKKASYKIVVKWLLNEGYIFVNANNKKEPTEKGLQIGISYKSKVLNDGRFFYAIEYNKEAQAVILENIINGNINFNAD